MLLSSWPHHRHHPLGTSVLCMIVTEEVALAVLSFGMGAVHVHVVRNGEHKNRKRGKDICVQGHIWVFFLHICTQSSENKSKKGNGCRTNGGMYGVFMRLPAFLCMKLGRGGQWSK